MVANVPRPAQPVLVEEGKAIATNRQLTEKLLCAHCEQRFGVWEDHVARLAVQDHGGFPWRADLKPVVYGPPVTVSRQVARASSEDTKAVTAFAVSVVWRASVSTVIAKTKLGAYEEPFRAFLSGTTETFPADARLVVSLVDTGSWIGIERVATMPKSERAPGFQLNWFVTCGIRFDLFVGDQLPPGSEGTCFARKGLVLLRPPIGSEAAILAMIGRAKGRGKLARRES